MFFSFWKKHQFFEYSVSSLWPSRVMPQMCRECADLIFFSRKISEFVSQLKFKKEKKKCERLGVKSETQKEN